MLQQQFTGLNATAPKVLQVSDGFTYTLDNTKSGADKVVVDSIRLNGQPLDLSATYRVTVNNFLAGGGDNYTVFAQGTNRYVGEIDLEAFRRYLETFTPTNPGPQNRITFVP
jgi:5'-nucleotidase